jgi:hypothetical protein
MDARIAAKLIKDSQNSRAVSALLVECQNALQNQKGENAMNMQNLRNKLIAGVQF